eukprot:777642-Prorocentrum_lima.AAC.1
MTVSRVRDCALLAYGFTARAMALGRRAARAALGACPQPVHLVDRAVWTVLVATQSGRGHCLSACAACDPAVPPPGGHTLHARTVGRRHAPHAG